jgi:hypothetical protein
VKRPGDRYWRDWLSDTAPADYVWKRPDTGRRGRKHATFPEFHDGLVTLCNKDVNPETWVLDEYGSARMHTTTQEHPRCEPCGAIIRVRQGSKVCPKCGVDRPLSQFFRQAGHSTGLAHVCKTCQTEANRLHERRQILDSVALLGGACIECGYDTDHRALRVVPDLSSASGREAKVWFDKQPVRSWRVFMNAVLKANGAGYLLLCSNCLAIRRWVEAEGGGRKMMDLISL